MSNKIKFAVVAEMVQIFENAKEAAKAFEAAENAALVVTGYDLIADVESSQVRKDLGLVYQAGQWPWYGKENAKTYQGRAYWYGLDPSIFTMEKGKVSSESWDRAFVALMRAKGW